MASLVSRYWSSDWHGRAFFAAVLVIVGFLNWTAAAQPTFLQRLLASSIMFVAAYTAWRWISRRDSPLPILPMICGIFAIYYSLPIFILERYSRAFFLRRVIPSEAIEFSLALCLLGMITMVAGYYVIGDRPFLRLVPRLRMEWSDYGSVELMALGLGVVGLTAYYVDKSMNLPDSVAQIVHYFSELALIAIGILYLLDLKRKLRFSGRVFLWGVLIPIRGILGLGTGFTWQGLEVVLPIVIVYATIQWRIPVRVLAIWAFALFLLYPIRSEFRALTWTGVAADRLPHEKALLYITTAWEVLSGQGMTGYERFEESSSRLNHLMTFAEVTEMTPDIVPYWMGETYYPLLLKPIPRFLYPDKPLEDTGQSFGHRYGFLSRRDLETSYNFPQLVEFYSNFGWIGVLLGMPLIGMIYRLVTYVFIHEDAGVGAVISGVYVTSKLILIESSFSLVIGGLFWGLFYLFAVHFLMTLGQTRAPSGARRRARYA